MESIGAYEAKTKLSWLLERVAAGEIVAIAKHGHPAALLTPSEPQAAAPADTVAHLRAARADLSLGGVAIRDLIDEGRLATRDNALVQAAKASGVAIVGND